MSGGQTEPNGTTDRPQARSLVVLTAPVPSADPARRPAGFLTQLLACEDRLAPFRTALREEPSKAGAAYRGRAAEARAQLDVVV